MLDCICILMVNEEKTEVTPKEQTAEQKTKQVEPKEDTKVEEKVEEQKEEKKEEKLKMAGKKDNKLREEIEIPEGINTSIEGDILVMKKEDKELKRKLNPLVGLKIEDHKITLKARKSTKRDKKIFGTMRAHIKNMIKGLEKDFTYKLEVANVHFPMNVSHDKEKNELVVKNFLGEKTDRRIKLIEGINIKLDKTEIEVSSADIEKAGQTATNIEKGTRVRNKDRRIFQDGIFIVEKPGRKFL